MQLWAPVPEFRVLMPFLSPVHGTNPVGFLRQGEQTPCFRYGGRYKEIWRRVQGKQEKIFPVKLFNLGAGQALLSIQLRPQGEGGNSAISSMFVWVPGCEGEASMPMPASTAGKYSFMSPTEQGSCQIHIYPARESSLLLLTGRGHTAIRNACVFYHQVYFYAQHPLLW